MTTVCTIRAKRNAITVRRSASLSSFPDLSESLEIGNRSSSGANEILSSSTKFGLCDLSSSDTHHCQSDISVSFLGSRIRRQYQSSFLLSEDQAVGVTRCEIFHPEDAKADVRVSLSLFTQPDEYIGSGQRSSQSAPILIRDSLGDKDSYAHLILTTNRPRDSELLGRIGSRNYFAKNKSDTPNFLKRIASHRKEEEHMSLRSPLADLPSNEDLEITKASVNTGPSPQSLEKKTYKGIPQHNGNHDLSTSPPDRIPSSKLLSETPEPQSILTQQMYSCLPSTERSESIIYLERSRSENSRFAQAFTSTATPFAVSITTETGADEESALPTDNILSFHTNSKGVDDVEVVSNREQEETRIKKNEKGVESLTSPTLHLSEVAQSANGISDSHFSLISATNGMVRLSGADKQECIHNYNAGSRMKSTILHTSLQIKKTDSLKSDEDSSSLTTLIIGSPDCEGQIPQDWESSEIIPTVPLPKVRERMPQQKEESDNVSQTNDDDDDDDDDGDDDCGDGDGDDDSDSKPDTESDTKSDSESHTKIHDYPDVEGELFANSDSQIPTTLENPLPRPRAPFKAAPSNSLSSNSSIECFDQTNPKVSLIQENNASLNQDMEEVTDLPDDALSRIDSFRSPFDPRSEEDLAPIHRGGGGRKHRHHRRADGESEKNQLFDEFRVDNSDNPDRKESEPQPSPRRPRRKDDLVPRSDLEISLFDEDENEEDSGVDEESRLRPPALPINFEAALDELPVEDYAMHTKRLRPLQYPLYVHVGEERVGIGADIYNQSTSFEDARPLRALKQNILQYELADTLVIRTRRRTMSGVTGFLPRSSTLSSNSIWFGHHAVPTKTQINASEKSPLRLSSIQLQAQAEIARRCVRSNQLTRNPGSSHSLERSRALGPSISMVYRPSGGRMRGGAPLIERAIKRRASKRDGYETLSLVRVPKLRDQPSSVVTVTTTEQPKFYPSASSASTVTNPPLPIKALRNQDGARSLVAQAAVDLAVSPYDYSPL